MDPLLSFSLHPYNGYALKWSPFLDSKIAVSTATNFGLVGNGRLVFLKLTPNGIVVDNQFDTQDALYDVAWSECHEEQAVVACGDGSVKLFDVSVSNYPVLSWHEHNREVYGVNWNLVTKDTFASSSWDGTVKIWSPHRPSSILSLPTHSCTYDASFSPHETATVSAVTTDSHLRIFDLRTPASARNHLVTLIPIHGGPPRVGQVNCSFRPAECLTHDWNKYRSHLIATAGVDRMVRTFDTRMPRNGPLAVLTGHEFAIRRLAWSPHASDMLLTGSYDMTCGLWCDGSSVGKHSQSSLGTYGGQIGSFNRHREFVTGVDWCLFGNQGWAASTAWDGTVIVWDAAPLIRPLN